MASSFVQGRRNLIVQAFGIAMVGLTGLIVLPGAVVPQDQRPPLLAMLRALSPQARDDLALLARRLPAAERERLRRELLEAPAQEREALVRERLGR